MLHLHPHTASIDRRKQWWTKSPQEQNAGKHMPCQNCMEECSHLPECYAKRDNFFIYEISYLHCYECLLTYDNLAFAANLAEPIWINKARQINHHQLLTENKTVSNN